MSITCDSSQTNRLLQRVRERGQEAFGDLFARHQERLRKLVRLRMDRRLRGRISSSAVLEQVRAEAGRRLPEYLSLVAQALAAPPVVARSETVPHQVSSLFLWLRQLTGEFLQALHQQHLGAQAWDAGQELSLYRGAMPLVHSGTLAAQLLGNRAASQSAIRADLMLRLQDALNSMDLFDREILALCHFEELTEAETAALLRIDRGAATKHYVAALKRLNEILKSIPGFFEKPDR
jgi:RNA polymerase sigma-70 factor (ECF subfamily)